MKPEKLTEDKIQNAVKAAITSAVDFVSSEIVPDRIKAQRYFEGECDVPFDDNRSKIVSTKCRDAVRSVKPALMRIFLQSGRPVEFAATRPDAAIGADQATKYAKMIFDRNNGFTVLHDAIHDALIKKTGIVKVFYDESEEVEIDNYSGLTSDQFALISQDDELEIIEQAEEVSLDPMMGPVATYSAKVARVSKRGKIKFESVAPEDFFIDRGAKSIHDFYVCGHTTEARVGDLVAMGFDFEDVIVLAGPKSDTTGDEEQIERAGWDALDEDESAIDPSMRKIVVTEAYMRMDIEGTGVPRLYKFICGGGNYEVLDYEPCDHDPFAVFEIDPEPHTFFGRSLVEIITDDQDASTSLLRGFLDSVTWLNNPRMIVNPDMVKMDDLLNNEFGGVIRARSMDAVREVQVGGAAQVAMPGMQYYDDIIRQKTGITGAGMGLDVDALSSQTAAGVRLAEQTSNAVADLMARVLAESGLKHLFKIIAQLARQHPDQAEMIRVDGQFVPVDPRSWATDMDTIVNVGIGTGRHEERMMTLNQTLGYQLQAWQMGGPQNGLVSLTNMRATLVDILELGGVNNPDRYYQPMTPEIEAQLMEAMQAQQQEQPATDPNQAYIEAEKIKAEQRMMVAQQKAELDGQKAQAEFSFRAQENAMKDDLERDKMLQDLAIKVADILGKYNIEVDAGAILQGQEMPR